MSDKWVYQLPFRNIVTANEPIFITSKCFIVEKAKSAHVLLLSLLFQCFLCVQNVIFSIVWKFIGCIFEEKVVIRSVYEESIQVLLVFYVPYFDTVIS